MNVFRRTLVTGLLMSVTISACVVRSQVIRLNPPTVSTVGGNGGNIGEVVLSARDTRPSPVIGRRATGSRDVAAITTDTDIASLLQMEMSRILKEKGFRVLSTGASTVPTLEIQLKELSYSTFDVSGKRKVKIQAVLETLIKYGPKDFRKSFQAQQERQVVFEPVAKSNEEWINETLADAFKEVTNDLRIYSYLK